MDYGKDFFLLHFIRARPENAGNLCRDISALFHNLFSKEAYRDWLVDSYLVRGHLDYCFYPTASIQALACFWLDTIDCSLVNSRAEMTLQWLLLETKQLFEENAHTSSIASAAGPFIVLFSYIAIYWY
jgi:hypothetical protein